MKTKTARKPIKSRVPPRSKTSRKLVRIAGLEPARLAALPPQSSVSANSTISATGLKLNQQNDWTQADSGSSHGWGASGYQHCLAGTGVLPLLPTGGEGRGDEAIFIECPSPHSCLAGRGRKFLVVVTRCAPIDAPPA